MAQPRWRARAGLLAVLAVVACNADRTLSKGGGFKPPPLSERARYCRPSSSSHAFAEIPFVGSASQDTVSFNQVRSAVVGACAGCHGSPAKAGGFEFLDAYRGREVLQNGVPKFIPGLHETAEKIRDVLLNEKMPPEPIRIKNPDAFRRIGELTKAWVDAGRPEGNFNAVVTGPTTETSDLGDCIPLPEAVGADASTDARFASVDKLPVKLADTDLFSLDALELARKGTLAYDVEYPLWADNAEKGRWIHVPAGQKIRYDAAQKKFFLPENTRFYKTFYKAVRGKAGKTRFRKVEPRLILVRRPWSKALFGTYRWNEAETSAVLVETPYRDGSPFKDSLFSLITDEATGATRPYAIPAKHRCVECHMGSDRDDFVLGFTPLQIHRRRLGEGGRTEMPGLAELTQVERFRQYGLLEGVESEEALPKLEELGAKRPRNVHELRVQGYAVGNCAHCHNPRGFAMKLNEVKLNLDGGELFDFATHQKSMHFPASQQKRFVDPGGDLERSFLWFRLAASADEQGLFSPMPLHTPGGPDCQALLLTGKWIRSFESEEAASAFTTNCKAPETFAWIEQDFTWPQSEHYVPRRADWKDEERGMPKRFRELRFSPGLQALARTKVPVGYWMKKPQCRFPTVNLPKDHQRPWMVNASGQPVRPFGEVYESVPGAWYFTTTCAKCHGVLGDGDTAFAKSLLTWSGGSVRVANLMDGMFGNKSSNLAEFASPGGNLGGNYLIWMAMEGTLVKFPAQATKYLGKHKAQMLNQVAEKCVSHIPSAQQVSKPIYQDYEIFRNVCFFENGSPNDPALQFDPDSGLPVQPAQHEAWLERAAFNAGWMIFDYLSRSSQSGFDPNNSECEKVFTP